MTVRTLHTAPGADAHLDEVLAEEIRKGLGVAASKKLPPSLLYDGLGSALFEAICLLPEYGLARADERILRRNAAAIVRAFPTPLLVAELGSGSGQKTRWILEALAPRQTTRYIPIDISAEALARCEAEIGRIACVRFEPIQADYIRGLREVIGRRRAGQRLLLLFLGSTIGNFERVEAGSFLREVRKLLSPGDALLLGTDLVKPVPMLIDAYDDALGVTAAFNRNVLRRINRDYEADFDLADFRHQARWHEPDRRIEMHLVAQRPHAVTIRALDMKVRFGAGESIWTESSYKFEEWELAPMGERAGFRLSGQWFDEEWAFAENLYTAR